MRLLNRRAILSIKLIILVKSLKSSLLIFILNLMNFQIATVFCYSYRFTHLFRHEVSPYWSLNHDYFLHKWEFFGIPLRLIDIRQSLRRSSSVICCLCVVDIREWCLGIRVPNYVLLRVKRWMDRSRRWIFPSSLLRKLVSMKLRKTSCRSCVIKAMIRSKLVSKLLLSMIYTLWP